MFTKKTEEAPMINSISGPIRMISMKSNLQFYSIKLNFFLTESRKENILFFNFTDFVECACMCELYEAVFIELNKSLCCYSSCCINNHQHTIYI